HTAQLDHNRPLKRSRAHVIVTGSKRQSRMQTHASDDGARVPPMIEYDKHNWMDHLFDIDGSMVREILGRVTACVAWSALIAAFHVLVQPVGIIATPHTLVGLALGLLMVFRTNSSYDRYWEGRRQWGSIINESRNLARGARAYLAGDPA